MNTGLLVRLPRATDYVFGGITGSGAALVRPGGNWLSVSPAHEVQARDGLDTMACVSFSALNALETYLLGVYGMEWNFSDRFTAKISGTTRTGNYLTAVGDSIRNYGVVNEADWGFPPGATWDEFYSAVPASLLDEAATWAAKWHVAYEWAYAGYGPSYNEILEYGPIQVAMEYAKESWKDSSGVYYWHGYNPDSVGHATLLLHIDQNGYKFVQDHYGARIKKLAPDYPLPFGLLYTINKKEIPFMQLEENKLYQLVEGLGGFGLAVGGKLIVEQRWELLASFIVRNGGKTDGNVRTIGQADWDSVPKINLKGQPV